MFKGISIYSFIECFKTEDDCRQYLFDLKWKHGYRCRQCGNRVPYKGRTRFHARCKDCYYDESVTANTVFHKIKIPLVKAFGMAYRISTRKKGMSTLELSREYGVSQKAAWLFKRKAQEAMQGVGNHLFDSSVQIDESLIHDAHKSADDSIQNTKMDTIVLKRKRNTWRQQNKSERRHSHIGNVYSRSSIIIANLHRWVGGIHHHCSSRFHDGYRDEYYFRLNGKDFLETLLHGLIAQFMRNKPYYYKAKEA